MISRSSRGKGSQPRALVLYYVHRIDSRFLAALMTLPLQFISTKDSGAVSTRGMLCILTVPLVKMVTGLPAGNIGNFNPPAAVHPSTSRRFPTIHLSGRMNFHFGCGCVDFFHVPCCFGLFSFRDRPQNMGDVERRM